MKVNILLSVCFVLATLLSNATAISIFGPTYQINIEPTEEYQEYATINEIRIECKRKKCTPVTELEQNLILYRYTNLSNDIKTVLWAIKMCRTDNCINCSRIIHPAYTHSVTLQPNELIELDWTSKTVQRIYIFDNFIKLVSGEQEQLLTNFELIDLNVE